MTLTEIAHLRLTNLLIAPADASSPAAVVEHLGALQAQDYPGALWAIGLRMPHAVQADIEQAVLDKTIVRTWPMRGTLHFVPARDIKWMIELLTPRVISSVRARRQRLEIDDNVLAKARVIAEKLAITPITRANMMAAFEAAGIRTADQRGYHILWELAQTGVLCLGPQQGKEQTFVLLDQWLPDQNAPSRAEALAILAHRYFQSHGPATERDFAGWAKLSLADARAVIHVVRHEFVSETVAGAEYLMPQPTASAHASGVFLLPGFDEYVLGYKDRSAVIHIDHAQKVVPGNNGMFLATIVSNGAIVGTWKKTVRKSSIAVVPSYFEAFSAAETQELQKVAVRYGHFMGTSGRLA
jgi:hypothetical protein